MEKYVSYFRCISLGKQYMLKPVLSWNGKRGRCKRRSTRATGLKKLLGSIMQSKKDNQDSKGNKSNKMQSKKQLRTRDGPPRGDPGLGSLKVLPWLPVPSCNFPWLPVTSRGLPWLPVASHAFRGLRLALGTLWGSSREPSGALRGALGGLSGGSWGALGELSDERLQRGPLIIEKYWFS